MLPHRGSNPGHFGCNAPSITKSRTLYQLSYRGPTVPRTKIWAPYCDKRHFAAAKISHLQSLETVTGANRVALFTFHQSQITRTMSNWGDYYSDVVLAWKHSTIPIGHLILHRLHLKRINIPGSTGLEPFEAGFPFWFLGWFWCKLNFELRCRNGAVHGCLHIFIRRR